MNAGNRLLGLGATLGILLAHVATVAAEVPKEYRETVAKGLRWLAKNQHKDGYWAGRGGQYPVALTALAGMALVLEGSTPREGAYSDNLRRAADWLVQRSQANGLIGDLSNSSEQCRYMLGHGFAMLFLAHIYADEENVERRKKLVNVLEKAVAFSVKAQTTLGGWYYVSARDAGDVNEAHCTVVQLRALRAARNAGISVPAKPLAQARSYLEKGTTKEGGIVYSQAVGGKGAPCNNSGRPIITAAALAIYLPSEAGRDVFGKQWLKFCKDHIVLDAKDLQRSFSEYQQYYFAQVHYRLGDQGYQRLFPQAKQAERLTWSGYKEIVFPVLQQQQRNDGSWGEGTTIGPVFVTALNLAVLQLDNGLYLEDARIPR